ncbi:hypothetical protein EU527_07925 [Candidatus Thorarchaeota archaeon]|nr:MAG: hypothetical protein EU527_07925 [Candidatus Thorarchaeota archaeon]
MALDHIQMIQTQLGKPVTNRHVTAFSPPGVIVEAAKYPVLMAGVLASTEPSEWLSIYDHPEGWSGLDKEAITSMRRRLYRFAVPVDARAMEPSDIIETLQTIALSVSPVAIEVETSSLPPRKLHALGGQLPASPLVYTKSFDIISEPEISRVAKRITEQDITVSEASWKLFDYEYTLDQVARLMAVGLLGRLDSRRLVPSRGAYKAIIDSYISRSMMELLEKPVSTTYRLSMSEIFGDNFTILTQPGESQVDYLRIERIENGLDRGVSIQGARSSASDSKTAVFADHARFSAFSDLVKKKESAHITIFHFSRNGNNNVFGPWLVRSGVKAALGSQQIELDSRENTLSVLESLLSPDISVWTKKDSLVDSFTGVFRIIENNSPTNR